ncbi:hypothetical protein KEM48_008859 [Puccinia striiformis f. sp. tritici PST-130]|nr:hypothetical protein KEM48_008859 [Puccinia striiformis f. sp. tritici PST-130]
MYSQKVEQGMDKSQFGDWSQFNNVKINIINYTEIIAAESSLRCCDTRDRLLQTKLERDSVWQIRRVPWTGHQPSNSVAQLILDTLHGFHPSSDPSNDDGLTNSDIVSNGLSDENDQASCLSEPSIETPIDLKIARNYRLLLPETFIEPNPSSVTSAETKTLESGSFDLLFGFKDVTRELTE